MRDYLDPSIEWREIQRVCRICGKPGAIAFMDPISEGTDILDLLPAVCHDRCHEHMMYLRDTAEEITRMIVTWRRKPDKVRPSRDTLVAAVTPLVRHLVVMVAQHHNVDPNWPLEAEFVQQLVNTPWQTELIIKRFNHMKGRL